jgi:spermidine synthase
MVERVEEPWVLIDSADVPADGNVIRLYQRGKDYSIKVEASELMTSGIHGSEDALAVETCRRLTPTSAPRLLIGGLGLGYTLSAALRSVGPHAIVEVAEVVPAIVSWNRTILGHLAGHPLDDPRTRVVASDVGAHIALATQPYHAIMLDVDNGPRALTRAANGWLYSPAGLAAAQKALVPEGILAVWSAWPDRSFTSRMTRAGFSVTELPVRARGAKGGRKHHLWLGVNR